MVAEDEPFTVIENGAAALAKVNVVWAEEVTL